MSTVDPSFGRADEDSLRADIEGRSLGELVGRLSNDFSKLMRLEIALAKSEAKEEASRAGKGVGLLGGAGVAGNLALVFISLTVMFALGNIMDLEWAALIVTVIWAIVAAVMAVAGRKALRAVQPLPETTQSLKEDAQWVKTQRG